MICIHGGHSFSSSEKIEEFRGKSASKICGIRGKNEDLFITINTNRTIKYNSQKISLRFLCGKIWAQIVVKIFSRVSCMKPLLKNIDFERYLYSTIKASSKPLYHPFGVWEIFKFLFNNYFTPSGFVRKMLFASGIKSHFIVLCSLFAVNFKLLNTNSSFFTI